MTVKVYTTPTCPYCTMVKGFLRANNVDFEELNVAVDRNAAIEMVKRSGQMGVPVVDVNGTIIVGFDSGAIAKALNG